MRVLLAALILILAHLVAAPRADAQAPPMVWRISLENSSGHVQVLAVRRFARRFEELAEGRVQVQVFDGAALYRDVDLPHALSNDRVEMGVPGMWQLDRFEAGFGVFLLPLFYGRSPDVEHEVADGPLGSALADSLSQRLRVVVPGRWLHLGAAHIFTFDKPIRRKEDFAGLRLRVAGGVANELRLRVFGADTVRIAWPDLPEAINSGKLDGVLTTYETIDNSSFKHRVRHVYEDGAYFPRYLPLISRGAWRRLAPDLRRLLVQAWEENVAEARSAAVNAQAEARRRLVGGGLTVVTPTPREIRANREALEAFQDEIAAAAKVEPNLVEAAALRFRNVEVDP